MKAANRTSPKRRTARVAPTQAANVPDLRPTTVLLAHESADLRTKLAAQLRGAGYAVLEADQTDTALSIFQDARPDIVMWNWALAGTGAAAFCRTLRSLELQQRCYLMVLSSSAIGADITEGLEAGADDFVTLPISGPKLLGRLAVGRRVMQSEAELRASNEQLRAALEQLRETQAAIDRDLREARKLQQGLVKERSGRFGSIQLSLLLRPAGHIGGDLVGFFPIGEDRVGIYALDVSGHGVTAALLTAQLSVHLSGSADQNVALRAAQTGTDAVNPAALAHFFNNMMIEEMATDTYYTMIYAELNHVTGRLRLVQAGHPHPVLQRADGSVQPLGNGGMPIGVFENPIFDEIDVVLGPGDRLLICSDGITEAANPSGRLLGDEGVEAILRTNAFLGGHVFLESMAWSVSEYCRGERQDDMSAVLIEHLAPAEMVPLPGR